MIVLVMLACSMLVAGAGPIAFAEREIARAGEIAKRPAPAVAFRIAPPSEVAADGHPLGSEGYRIEPGARDGTFLVVAGDERGAMYGGLDIAEAIAARRPVRELTGSVHRPALRHRQFKQNLPLPGTGYLSAEALAHNAWFFDDAYWDAFLDLLARSRFNVLSLWSAHPYPQMVRLDRFPEVQDVARADLEQNIRLFHSIFAKAKSRGLDVMLVTWNVHVSPSFARANGIGESGVDSPLVRDYQRECVRAVLAEYPELGGIGTCPGEAMPEDARGREEFIRDTYLAGITASGRRDVVFLQRYWGADPQLTQEVVAQASPVPMLLSIKYNGEHMYSSPEPHFFDARWLTQQPRRYDVIWHLRNDDLFTLRWGEPRFAAMLMRNAARTGVGFLTGSEVWIDGVDYIHTAAAAAHVTWRYDFERLWLRYAIWGRMGYDPGTEDRVFIDQFAARFGGDLARPLFDATIASSRLYPRLTAFHWNYMNGDWYPEGCVGNWVTGAELGRGVNLRVRESIFHDVLEFVFNHTIDDRLVCVPELVAQRLAGKEIEPGRITPFMVADALDADARSAARALALVPQDGLQGELACTVLDLRTQIELARYYAQKIRGAAHLGLHIAGLAGEQAQAVSALGRALDAWQQVVLIGDRHYREHEVWLMGAFSWGRYLADVQRDKELARACRADADACRRSRAFQLPFDHGLDLNGLVGELDLGVAPFDPPAPLALEGSKVFIEAEDFLGPWREQTNYPSYRGRGFRCANQPGSLATSSLHRRIAVSTAGAYVLWVRGLVGHAQDQNAERSVCLAVDGVPLAPTQTAVGVPPQFVWERAGQVTLAVGIHDVEIRDHGPGFEHPDCVLITSDAKLDPSQLGS
ncbi:MAG: hypothetical protein U1E76_04410 [Planctomycetota bacterium]